MTNSSVFSALDSAFSALQSALTPRFLRYRRREPEWLDDPAADPEQIRKSMIFIRRINRALGYGRVIIHKLDRFSENWDRARTFRILDVGTGAADIPLAILKWADDNKLNVEIIGLDINPQIAVLAAAMADDPRLKIVRGDALNLCFDDGSFDYAITSMFLHHLDDADASQAMAEMGRVARRGVVISDLLRMRHAYFFIWLFTLMANPMVRHDARLSVAQAFSRGEVCTLRDRAGLRFAKFSTHLRHRFVLAGEKLTPSDSPA